MRGHKNNMSNKKIACFFATSGHSGVDRAMQHLIPAFVRRGYQVDLLHVRKHGPYLEPMPGLNIIDMGSRHVYSSFIKLVDYLKAFQPCVMLSDKDRVNRTALLARFIARGQTKIVVSTGTTVSIDLNHRGTLDRWLQKLSMGKLYRLADAVIVTSTGVADDMANYTGLARSRIKVVPSPVIKASLFYQSPDVPDHPWYQKKDKPIIVSVGALTQRKDFPTLLRAFARLHKNRPSRLLILGKGKEQQRLQALTQQLGIAANVDFPGFVESPYAFLAHADLFAFSSRWEGLGFVIIEALALGTPVVSTDCPSGPKEILQNGRYGRLVPVGDERAMAVAMMAGLDQPQDKSELQQAVKIYEIEHSTDCYLAAMGLSLNAAD